MTNTLSALKKWERPFPIKKTPATQGDAKTEDSQEYFKLWSQAEDGLYPFGNNGQWHGGIHFDKNTEGSLEQESGVRCIADGEVIAYRIDQSYPVADFGDKGKAVYSSGFVLVRHRLQYPSELMPVPATPSNTPAASNPPTSTASNAASSQPAAAANPPPRPEGPSLVLYSLYMHLRHWKAYRDDLTLEHPKFWVSDPLKREVGEKAKDDNPGWNTPPGESATKGLNVRNSNRSQKIGWLPRGARLTLAPGNESDKWRQIASVDQGKMQFNPATNPGQEVAGWVYVQELETLASKPASFDTVYIPPKPLPIQAGEIVGHLGEYQRSRDARPLGTPSRPLLHLELFGGADVPSFIEECRKFAGKLDDTKKPLLQIEVGAKLVQPWHSDLKLTAADGLVLSADSPKEGPWIKVQRGTFEVVPNSQLPRPYRNQAYADGRILYRVVKQDGSEITEAQYNGLSAAEKQSCPKRKVLKLSDQVIWIERQHLGDASQKIMRPTKEIPAWSAFPLQVGKAEMLPAAYTRVIDVKPLPSLKDDQGRQWWETTVGVGKNGRVKGWVCEKGHPKVKRCSPWEWPGFDFTALDETTPLEWFKRKLLNNYTPDNVLLKKLFEVVDADENGQLSPRELRFSWQIDWQIQALSRLVIEHGSEWGQPMSLWDELDSLLQREAWEEEKKRIAKLQWWNQVKGKHGFPNSIQVHHFHPLAVIENFGKIGCNSKECDVPYLEYQTTVGIFKVSKEAFDFILRWEGYKPHPYVPMDRNGHVIGASGITIGYGYDLGQQTAARIRSDLQGIFPTNEIEMLAATAGKRIQNAVNALPSVRNISVSRDQAYRLSIVMKRHYAQLVVEVYPQAIELHPHCQGMLLSLVVNRGNSFTRPNSASRLEMRQIAEDFAANKLEQIPGRFRTMKRLWPGSEERGLRIRRDEEAALFERGLTCTCFGMGA